MVQKMNWIRAAFVAAFLIVLGSAFTFSQSTATNIEKMSGWESCTVCAGKAGNGPIIQYSMKAGITNPSMGTKSTQFSVGGNKPYGAALWWKQLGGKPSASHFVYDLYFYIKNPSVSQALEFDVNQSVKSKKYIFGTQCNLKGSHAWDTWSKAARWKSTGIGCSVSAFKWHHLVWEFQRTSDSKVKFVSVTYDGVKKYVNKVVDPQSSGVSELNVAFQMDGNSSMTSYQTWLEKVSLNYW